MSVGSDAFVNGSLDVLGELALPSAQIVEVLQNLTLKNGSIAQHAGQLVSAACPIGRVMDDIGEPRAPSGPAHRPAPCTASVTGPRQVADRASIRRQEKAATRLERF